MMAAERKRRKQQAQRKAAMAVLAHSDAADDRGVSSHRVAGA